VDVKIIPSRSHDIHRFLVLWLVILVILRYIVSVRGNYFWCVYLLTKNMLSFPCVSDVVLGFYNVHVSCRLVYYTTIGGRCYQVWTKNCYVLGLHRLLFLVTYQKELITLTALMYVLVPMPCMFFGGGSTQFLISRDGGG